MDRNFDLDRTLWQIIWDAVGQASRAVKCFGRKPRFSNQLIVSMYLWSVWHDRCQSWACDKRHYGRLFRPRKLPSISQFNRRIASEECQLILQRVHDRLSGRNQTVEVGYFDGKPLTVSAVSKDPDARSGHITGGFAKGYKLHAYVTEDRRIVIWSVMPLNTAEQTVALAMVDYLPPQAPHALNLADGNYDSAPLHKALNQRQATLLTPLKGQNRVKNGQHHEVTLRQMGPGRREALTAWQQHPDLVQYLLNRRNNIEGTFSVASVAMLLSLPPFVRRLGRVRRWVGGKIILYHARQRAMQQATAAAA
jgi:hypothetical protein